jgi:hypothetical protein
MQVLPPTPDRRLQRVSATITISLLLEQEDSSTEHAAYTVDISSKGARVRTAFVLIPGQMVGIVASEPSGQAIPSRVVWVQRSSVVGSLAGLEFLDPPPASIAFPR